MEEAAAEARVDNRRQSTSMDSRSNTTTIAASSSMGSRYQTAGGISVSAGFDDEQDENLPEPGPRIQVGSSFSISAARGNVRAVGGGKGSSSSSSSSSSGAFAAQSPRGRYGKAVDQSVENGDESGNDDEDGPVRPGSTKKRRRSIPAVPSQSQQSDDATVACGEIVAERLDTTTDNVGMLGLDAERQSNAPDSFDFFDPKHSVSAFTHAKANKSSRLAQLLQSSDEDDD